MAHCICLHFSQDSLDVVALKAHRLRIICHYGDSQSKQICLCDSGRNVHGRVILWLNVGFEEDREVHN